MNYSTNGIEGNSEQLEFSIHKPISIQVVRFNLFNTLLTSDKTSLPEKLREYTNNLNTIDQFWSVREILDFQSNFFYDNKDIIDLINNDPETLFSKLEEWLGFINKRQTAKSSGICQSASESIGKIERVINNIEVAKNVYESILDDLQSGKDIIELSKKVVDDIIDSYVDQIKNKIANIQNLISKIKSYHGPVIQKALKIRDELEQMSSEETVSKLKDQIQGQLGFTMSQFENFDVKELRHIMDRACSISNNISLPFEQKSRQIDHISSYYSSQFNFVESSSSQTTQNAINAGAYRYSSSTLQEKIPSIQTQEKIATEAIPGGVYDAPPSQEEIDGVTMWNNGQGDSRIGFSGQWVTKVGAEGWTRVDYRARVKLMRLQQLFGKRLIVNSGYRPPVYNKSIGGATNSCHIKGYALDITWSGFNASSKAQFIQLAKQVGFTGFGVNYRTFVHIDIGTPRSW